MFTTNLYEFIGNLAHKAKYTNYVKYLHCF